MGRRGRGLGDAWPDEAVSVWTRGPARPPILPPPYPLDRDSETVQTREWPAERFVGAEFSTAPVTTQTFGPGLGRPVRQPPLADPRARQTARLTAQLGRPTRRFTGELNPRPVTGPFGTRPLTGPFGRQTSPVLGQNPLFSQRRATGPLGQRRVTGQLQWQSPYVAAAPRAGGIRGAYVVLAFIAVALVALLFAANVLPPLSAVTDLFGGGAPPSSDTGQQIASKLPAPLLGSGREEFEALYGAAKAQTGDGAQYEVSISGRPVLLTVKWSQGVDQRARVFALAATPRTPAGPWDAATADAICNIFLPTDVTLAGATNGVGYTEYIYTSNALAQVFSSRYFVDDAYKAVAPGTLNRLDQISSSGQTGVTSCAISLGRH
jgi:hypothetical protein